MLFCPPPGLPPGQLKGYCWSMIELEAVAMEEMHFHCTNHCITLASLCENEETLISKVLTSI